MVVLVLDSMCNKIGGENWGAKIGDGAKLYYLLDIKFLFIIFIKDRF